MLFNKDSIWDSIQYKNNAKKNLYKKWLPNNNEYIINELLTDSSTINALEILESQLSDKPIYKPDGTLIKKKNNNKETETMNFNFGNMFNGMFKPIGHGYARMGANGKVAIKVGDDYKTFDINKMKLVNCDNFAFDMDGAFWVVPTFKVERGDIIMVNGKPRCVIEVKDKSIRTFSYENSTIDEIVPEHHVFMGKTYCYGKIFSPFMNFDKSDNMMTNMMQMAMMSQMFNGNNNGNNSFMGFNPFMFMMMNGKNNMFEGMFDGAFNFGEDEEDEKKTSEVK